MPKTCTRLATDAEATQGPAAELRAQLRKGATLVVRGRPCEVLQIHPFGSRGRGDHLLQVLYLDGRPPHTEHLLLQKEASVHPTTLLHLEQAFQMPLRQWLESGNEWVRDNLIPFPGMPGVPAAGKNSTLWTRETPVAPSRSKPDPDPHQLVGLEKALARRSVRLLLADEPGLGKTGQAALIAGELALRRRAFRMLVLCPPGLRQNWQLEMKRFAGLDFDILDHLPKGRQDGPLAPFDQTDRAIVSYHWLKQPNVLRRFLQSQQQAGPSGPWDLLIVDEAHHLIPPAGAASQLHQMAGRIVSWFPHRIFLTATPHSGYTDSLMGLLQLLDPLRFERTSSPSPAMRQAMRQVILRRTRKQIGGPGYVGLDSRNRLIHCGASAAEAVVHQAWQKAATSFIRWAGGDDVGAGCVALAVQVLNKRRLSSLPAFSESFGSWAQAILNRCGDAELHAEASPPPESTETDGEQAPRFGVSAEVLSRLARQHKLPLIQRIQAVQEALLACETSTETQAGDRLAAAARWVRRQAESAPGEKILLFTEYADTAWAMVRLLQGDNEAADGPDGRVAGLDSSVGEGRRSQVLARFCDPQDALSVLVTTDVAAEGLNLHTACRCVVHLDLPWNPGRLGQRTGRVLRRGQTRMVATVFVTGDSPEETEFLSRLAAKEHRCASDMGSGTVSSQLPPSSQAVQRIPATLFPQPAKTLPPPNHSEEDPAWFVCRQAAPEQTVAQALAWRTLLGPPVAQPILRTGSWTVATMHHWMPAGCSAALLALARWLAMDRCESWLLRWALPLYFQVAGWPRTPTLGQPAVLNPAALHRMQRCTDSMDEVQHPMAIPGAQAGLEILLRQLQTTLLALQLQGQKTMSEALRNQHRLLVQRQHVAAATLMAEQPGLPPARRLRRDAGRIQQQRNRLTGSGWLFPSDRMAALACMQQLEQQALHAADEEARLKAVALLDPRHHLDAARLARARTTCLAPPVLMLDAVALLLPDAKEVGP